jgi:hypothetical protein
MYRLLILFVSGSLLASCSNNPSQKPLPDSVSVQPNEGDSVFSWLTENCENKSIYDPTLYSAEQLQNTFDLWFTFGGILLEQDGTVFDAKDIPRLDSNKLSEEYLGKKTRITNMRLVPAPYWENLRKQKLQELEGEYELKKISITAYHNPGVLLQNRFTDQCNEYAVALASEDTTILLNAWKKMADRDKHKSDEAFYMNRFNQQYNSSEKLILARINLMNFGWWNCANHLIKRIENDGTHEKEFLKLFKKTKPDCEEAD